MAQVDVLPFEIKRLIYNHSDLPDIKQLRLASQSWAAAGIWSLLLPRFSINSFDDILRLKAIGASSPMAGHAARTVDTLVLPVRGWSPKYFRAVVSNRREGRNHYDVGEDAKVYRKKSSKMFQSIIKSGL